MFEQISAMLLRGLDRRFRVLGPGPVSRSDEYFLKRNRGSHGELLRRDRDEERSLRDRVCLSAGQNPKE
jgi:hypothetical protein